MAPPPGPLQLCHQGGSPGLQWLQIGRWPRLPSCESKEAHSAAHWTMALATALKATKDAAQLKAMTTAPLVISRLSILAGAVVADIRVSL